MRSALKKVIKIIKNPYFISSLPGYISCGVLVSTFKEGHPILKAVFYVLFLCFFSILGGTVIYELNLKYIGKNILKNTNEKTGTT